MIINGIESIEKIRNQKNFYDEIRINSHKLISEGVFRHAVKYSFWALKKDGKLVIQGKIGNGLGFSPNKIKFWQVRAEVFRLLKDEIITLSDDKLLDTLVVQKRDKTIEENCVSIGFVYGGNKNELALLKNSFERIKNYSGKTEILICGPSECHSEMLFHQYNVHYVSCDLFETNRVLYTKKKNLLFDAALYSYLIIAHARILITKELLVGIPKYNFDVITPRVIYKERDRNHAYLDYLLMEHYSLLLKRKHPTLGLNKINKRYLYHLKNKVPYIDGGITVFNKNSITHPPYAEYLGWGDAEDLEMCERLYQQGYLIDFAPELVCYTQTNKLDFNSSKIQRLKTRILKFFVK
jgi:hypothetical protein